MADEQKKQLDDEYQFPQEEYVSSEQAEAAAAQEMHSEETASAAQKSTGVAGLVMQALNYFRQMPTKKKRIVIAVIAAVLIIIVFRLFSSSVPAPAPMPQVTQQPVMAPQPVQMPSDSGALDSVTSRMSGAESKISNLQSQVTDMQNSLSQLQSTNQSLQQSMASMSAQIQALSSQLQAVVTQSGSKDRISYQLRAVVPDRAWVMSNDGETISVTMGDELKQYGTVTSIDAQRGVVLTSSGRKIEYGPNDY